MAAKKKRPAGRPPALPVERFAAARAAGKNRADAARIAGYPRHKSERAADAAGARMDRRPEVRKAIERHKRDLIAAMAKKQVADLWPSALHTLEGLLHDPKLSDANKLRAVELVARLTGHMNADSGGVQVNVVQVGEQARKALLEVQQDGAAQSAALDELQRRTLPAVAQTVDDAPEVNVPDDVREHLEHEAREGEV